MWEVFLDVTHLVKSFISLVFTKNHLFLFAFIWDMALICILVFNLESQVRNQGFFTAGEFSWNQGTSINIHLQHKKEKPHFFPIFEKGQGRSPSFLWQVLFYFFSLWICNISVPRYKLYLQFLMKIFSNKLFPIIIDQIYKRHLSL